MKRVSLMENIRWRHAYRYIAIDVVILLQSLGINTISSQTLNTSTQTACDNYETNDGCTMLNLKKYKMLSESNNSL